MKPSDSLTASRQAVMALAVLLGIAAVSCVSVPAPPSGLPNPYRGAKFEPKNAEEEKYFRYLEGTPMFPDREFCEQILKKEILSGEVERASAEWTWTEDPILAQGTGLAGLFSLIEAHVNYRDSSGTTHRSTFSCFVQYAGFGESSVWREGKLKYGGCLKKGHRKYIMCPARLPWAAPPGAPSTWQRGILRP